MKETLLSKRNNGFENIWQETQQSCEPPKKRRKPDSVLTVQEEYKRLYCEIYDTVTLQLRSRFASLPELYFLELMDCSKFSQFSQNFPEQQFSQLEKVYGKFFDFVRLKAALRGLYNSELFKGKDLGVFTSD